MPTHQVLKVEFSAFSIEESQSCQFDKLIFDGSSSCDFKSPRRHCGDIPPEPITSSGNILCLRFISDSHIRDSGFRLTIKISESEVESKAVEDHLTPALTEDKSGEFPRSSCSLFPMVLRSSTRITSPNFGTKRRYPPNSECRWLVYADTYHSFRLRFKTMAVEGNADCSYDYIRVLQGEESSPTFDRRYCGTSLPVPLELDTPMLIIFSSDHMFQYYGFSADVEFIPLLNNVSGASQEEIVATEIAGSSQGHVSTSYSLNASNQSKLAPETTMASSILAGTQVTLTSSLMLSSPQSTLKSSIEVSTLFSNILFPLSSSQILSTISPATSPFKVLSVFPSSTSVLSPSSTSVLSPSPTLVLSPSSTSVLSPSLTLVLSPSSTSVLSPSPTLPDPLSLLSLPSSPSSSVILKPLYPSSTLSSPAPLPESQKLLPSTPDFSPSHFSSKPLGLPTVPAINPTSSFLLPSPTPSMTINADILGRSLMPPSQLFKDENVDKTTTIPTPSLPSSLELQVVSYSKNVQTTAVSYSTVHQTTSTDVYQVTPLFIDATSISLLSSTTAAYVVSSTNLLTTNALYASTAVYNTSDHKNTGVAADTFNNSGLNNSFGNNNAGYISSSNNTSSNNVSDFSSDNSSSTLISSNITSSNNVSDFSSDNSSSTLSSSNITSSNNVSDFSSDNSSSSLSSSNITSTTITAAAASAVAISPAVTMSATLAAITAAAASALATSPAVTMSATSAAITAAAPSTVAASPAVAAITAT
ncbi:tolloid-like protein 1 [Plakobranchus ocellatus]|uniref:Tolloid-like protein 1 n=1 Tax=Plakobranchus ocellatus TaxID=259542 RepID=A0AAV4BI98_9GAST|nr:tolloid-like protein 1 [Plakobranchus ocellatus]